MSSRLKSWCRGPDSRGVRVVIVVLVLITMTILIVLGVPVETALAALLGVSAVARALIEIVLGLPPKPAVAGEDEPS